MKNEEVDDNFENENYSNEHLNNLKITITQKQSKQKK